MTEHSSATNHHGDTAPRAGFVHNFRKSEIVVKKWDNTKGELVDDNNDISDMLKGNLRDMDKFLGVYPYDAWDKWKSLSNKISEDLVCKLLPLSGVIHSALELSGKFRFFMLKLLQAKKFL